MTARLPVLWLIALAVGAGALALAGPAAREAAAHDAVVITLKSISTPNPGDPLMKVYTVTAAFADEGAPVEGARLELTARRQGLGGELPPVTLTPTALPGEYQAPVSFPTYGTWDVNIRVVEGGRGEATFVQEVLPPGSGAAGGQPVVRVVLGYELRDVLNILVRAVHLVSGAVWLIASGLVLAFSLISGPERPRRLAVMSTIYPLVAGGLLAVSVLTGIYNSLYNVPTVSPGIFDLGRLKALPFGGDYLATFFVKMGLVAGATVSSLYVAALLWRSFRSPLPAVAGGALDEAGWGPERRLAVAAGIAVVLGVLVLLDVVVLNYLHSLTHLGAFATSRRS